MAGSYTFYFLILITMPMLVILALATLFNLLRRKAACHRQWIINSIIALLPLGLLYPVMI